ncbi:MAG: sensor domain-containing diguanylate cyclase [Trueperaceae bacterium]|nr:MAG: sensor domain-containing diguanylate cyclase [Trueperaceae bacterium]
MHTATNGRELTQRELYALLEAGQDALFVTDPSGEVVYMNVAAIHLYGIGDRIEQHGGSINLRTHSFEAFDFRTLEGVRVADENRPVVRALRGERYRDVELLVRRFGDDDPRVYVYSGTLLEGDPPLSVLTVRDETDRWRSERRYRVAFEADPAPSVIARLADMHIVQANHGMAELTGLTTDDLTTRSLTDLEPFHRYIDMLTIATNRLLSGDATHKIKMSLRTSDGAQVMVLLSARAIEVDGRQCGIYTFVDITALETEQREHLATQDLLARSVREHADERDVMAYLAIFDTLTRIPNRRGLDVRLAEEFVRAERYGSALSVLLLDIDHFKAVNDEHGHDVGDAALRQVAHLLQEACRGPDFVGRWGGEEFMMILPETDTAAATDVASRVRARIADETFASISGLTVSIGVASFEPGTTTDALFRRVDRALYAAKRNGRNRVEVATPGLYDG